MEKETKETAKASDRATLKGITRVLCEIAGSDLTILENPKCSHEISRHSRIGAVIVSTALLATVSMFFAIQTVSQSILTGVIAGVLWGFVILILDSYIVASYRKSAKKWQEFKIVIPRLVLALILGCSISIPLELRVFSTEIQDEIIAMKSEKMFENQKKSNDEYEAKIAPLIKERDGLMKENQNLRTQINATIYKIDSLNDKMSLEQSGNGLSGQPGEGPSYRALEEQRNQIRDIDLPQIRENIGGKISDNLVRTHTIDSLVAATPRPLSKDVQFTGLSTQLDALRRLTTKSNYILFAYVIFFLLVLAVETAPIFVKLFSQKSSYDEVLEMNEYEIYILQQKKRSDLHEAINAELQAIRSANVKRIMAQDSVNEKLMQTIAEAQNEIGGKAIRLWKLQHLEQIDKNVEDYVRSKE